MSPSSLGGSTSSKKSKDKSSLSRSQSQRPARENDHGLPKLTAVKFKATQDEAGVKADTGLAKDSIPDPKAKPEPTGEIDVTNTQNTISGSTAASEDVSPSGGSSAALQPETSDEQGVTQADADLNPEEASSDPLSQGNVQTRTPADDGFESGPVSEPKEEAESGEPIKGTDKGNQNSDSIYW